MNKVLIANRGEIAIRIIKTLKKMGITSVVVVSDADKYTDVASLADEVYSLNASVVSESYLQIPKILKAMEDSGADAVHPGYGLLSENAHFVRAVEEKGWVFIGPRAEQIESFGLKDKARNLAESSGVPLVPGSPPLEDLESTIEAANQIGYPVMLKAAAGGGGIGMLRCANENELIKGYESVIDLAVKNFANGTIFLEKCIDNARHIEVQVFGDGKGKVIPLGTRDCSLQRRNQKVVEETPAINISSEIREKMEYSAQKLCEDHNYRNAGTVEFIYDCDNEKFYFLEVNTRLQVEHTVTEEVFQIDLVEWMVRLAKKDLSFWPDTPLAPKGHAFQARIYAEDPIMNFQPSTGEISHFSFGGNPRIDTWIQPGTHVSPYYDPLLAKVITHNQDRQSALEDLIHSLKESNIGGVQSNAPWLCELIQHPDFKKGPTTTKFISENFCSPAVVEVISPGIQTTVQDYPGRIGYWHVGVPPNGPMDSYSFQLGNRLLENTEDCAGLECLIQGPTLKFHRNSYICITGAEVEVKIDDEVQDMWKVLSIQEGSILSIGKILGAGSRVYVCIRNGILCPTYLNSRSTFTLGKFGGHHGRPLIPGDTLAIESNISELKENSIPEELKPSIQKHWDVYVLLGPHSTPEYLKDVQPLVDATWKVHFNSDRTGVRLIGPQPLWAREDGGEAGLHPSNLHDNAYAIGAMDFTGDQPVLLGPDGPSLGGFVCPLTIIKSDLWKMGQFSSEDTIKFIPISFEEAEDLLNSQSLLIKNLCANSKQLESKPIISPILEKITTEPEMLIRQSGDAALLCEFGDMNLDLELRIHVHFFMEKMNHFKGILYKEHTPGIRSIQLQFDPQSQSRQKLIARVIQVHKEVALEPPRKFESRIIHLPLSWDDPSTQIAIDKYTTNVRPGAPWCCPNNIEFIRRVNGLDSVEDVKDIVYNASYLVMGLGDVYLGAPVAVPLDPRHRLITTKYNPARTWTPENAVGIGGAYLCIYGMEGPGGYQFVGRTLPVWNRFRKSETFNEPYLLRFFDQIRFYEVSSEDLLEQRKAFLNDSYKIKIEESTFDVQEYQSFLDSVSSDAREFKARQNHAFETEKQKWRKDGVFNFDAETIDSVQVEDEVPNGAIALNSPISGSVWKCNCEAGEAVKNGQNIIILEAMKMEMEINAPCEGKIGKIFIKPGQTVQSGQVLGYIFP